jgi:hypothetical protein
MRGSRSPSPPSIGAERGASAGAPVEGLQRLSQKRVVVSAASDRRTEEIVRLLAAGDARPRLRMQGVSMLPLLREGMVLELRRFERPGARIGDVIVFPQDGNLVAHRIVGFGTRHIRTSGDNRPGTVEEVPADAVLGSVTAVFASEAPQAKRIDGPAFHGRGQAFARTRALRAAARGFASAAGRAAPWRRRPVFEALQTVLEAGSRSDGAAVERALEGADPAALFACASRHACLPLLQQALALAPASAAQGALAGPIRDSLRRDRARSFLLPGQIAGLVLVLSAGEVPFALLKGTARIYADPQSALLYPSHDIDILVPPDRLDDAIETLREHGYSFHTTRAVQARYRAKHHHAAPLIPPLRRGWFVELHTQLVPPGRISTPSDWDALAAHLTSIEGPSGPALAFDAFATAWHHALHGFQFDRFRDVVVCARALTELTGEQRLEIGRMAECETREPVRIRAFVAAAARFAGLSWPDHGPDVDAYLRWVDRREDMPNAVGRRAQVLEAWYASGGRPAAMRPWIVTHEATPLRLAGRVALAPLALGYARWPWTGAPGGARAT